MSENQKRTLLLIAGSPSHARGEHEFEAGMHVLSRCLDAVPGLEVEVHPGGWVERDSDLDRADAIVMYADGDAAHPAAQDGHLERLEELAQRGVGLGCLHYAVAVAHELGDRLGRWIGGYYEDGYSCNPKWEARFEQLPDHPITSGVGPFQIHDEWYFNIRFPAGAGEGDLRFWPILVATPSDGVRRGPYVHPQGPYPHVVAASGRSEVLAWALERPDGGRGFGFNGGHYHANWGHDDARRLVLNALVWLTGADVPPGGVESRIDADELEAALPA